MIKMLLPALRQFLLALLLIGASVAARGDTLVFAAASLKNALDEIAQHHQRAGGGKVSVSYAGSSALARQIEKGAPADVFISADTDWMDYVDTRRLLKDGARVNLVRNELVLIASAQGRLDVSISPGFPLAAMLGGGRLAMADPDHVPAGKYGKAALETLGVWPMVANRLARAENVRAALNFVARGEAPLGIVYRTDAASESRVRIVGTFPASTHPLIVYPAALLASSRSAEAWRFFTHLRSAAAMEVFRRHGFLTY